MQEVSPSVLVRNASYDYGRLKSVLFEILNVLDYGRIRQNSRVSHKPNFLAPASPDKQ